MFPGYLTDPVRTERKRQSQIKQYADNCGSDSTISISDVSQSTALRLYGL